MAYIILHAKDGYAVAFTNCPADYTQEQANTYKQAYTDNADDDRNHYIVDADAFHQRLDTAEQVLTAIAVDASGNMTVSAQRREQHKKDVKIHTTIADATTKRQQHAHANFSALVAEVKALRTEVQALKGNEAIANKCTDFCALETALAADDEKINEAKAIAVPADPAPATPTPEGGGEGGAAT